MRGVVSITSKKNFQIVLIGNQFNLEAILNSSSSTSRRRKGVQFKVTRRKAAVAA